jgi:hypothetical protein
MDQRLRVMVMRLANRETANFRPFTCKHHEKHVKGPCNLDTRSP